MPPNRIALSTCPSKVTPRTGVVFSKTEHLKLIFSQLLSVTPLARRALRDFVSDALPSTMADIDSGSGIIGVHNRAKAAMPRLRAFLRLDCDDAVWTSRPCRKATQSCALKGGILPEYVAHAVVVTSSNSATRIDRVRLMAGTEFLLDLGVSFQNSLLPFKSACYCSKAPRTCEFETFTPFTGDALSTADSPAQNRRYV